MFGAKMLMMKPNAAITVPSIATNRQPYLFVSILAIGPANKSKDTSNQMMSLATAAEHIHAFYIVGRGGIAVCSVPCNRRLQDRIYLKPMRSNIEQVAYP